MNVNSISGVRNYPGPVSATETAVASINPLGGSTTGGYTQQTLQVATNPRVLIGPSPDIAGGMFDGRPFKIRVVAQTVSSVASNFTANVYWNCGAKTNLLTFTSDVLVIGSGTQAVASVGGVIFMESSLIWDSTSKQLVGFWNEVSGVSSIPTTPAVIKTTGAVTATSPIGISSTASQASLATGSGLQFFCTFTNSGVVASTKLLDFSIDAI